MPPQITRGLAVTDSTRPMFLLETFRLAILMSPNQDETAFVAAVYVLRMASVLDRKLRRYFVYSYRKRKRCENWNILGVILPKALKPIPVIPPPPLQTIIQRCSPPCARSAEVTSGNRSRLWPWISGSSVLVRRRESYSSHFLLIIVNMYLHKASLFLCGFIILLVYSASFKLNAIGQ